MEQIDTIEIFDLNVKPYFLKFMKDLTKYQIENKGDNPELKNLVNANKEKEIKEIFKDSKDIIKRINEYFDSMKKFFEKFIDKNNSVVSVFGFLKISENLFKLETKDIEKKVKDVRKNIDKFKSDKKSFVVWMGKKFLARFKKCQSAW